MTGSHWVLAKTQGQSHRETGAQGDWRYPNVIRAAPVPLYNTFTDIYRFVRILDQVLDGFAR
jgi:kynureninase